MGKDDKPGLLETLSDMFTTLLVAAAYFAMGWASLALHLSRKGYDVFSLPTIEQAPLPPAANPRDIPSPDAK